MPQVPVHSALNSALVFFMGLVGEVGLLNVTRLLYTTSGTLKQRASYARFGLIFLLSGMACIASWFALHCTEGSPKYTLYST